MLASMLTNSPMLVKVSYQVNDDYCIMDIIKIFPVFISAKTGTFSNKTLVHELKKHLLGKLYKAM